MKFLNSKSDMFWQRRAILALLITIAILTGTVPVSKAQRPSTTRLNEDQRILHVLNRLGFGARPGDIERVKALGLEQYINQEIGPGKIYDDVSTTKLKNLSTLNMSTAELYEKYPQPGQLLR